MLGIAVRQLCGSSLRKYRSNIFGLTGQAGRLTTSILRWSCCGTFPEGIFEVLHSCCWVSTGRQAISALPGTRSGLSHFSRRLQSQSSLLHLPAGLCNPTQRCCFRNSLIQSQRASLHSQRFHSIFKDGIDGASTMAGCSFQWPGFYLEG